jgi:alanine-glyoxylate transaminase/serine-glyoxylate transaminase/serine-pyruvate transaminase
MVQSFHPPLRTLMGPGPSEVHPRVLAAMARPTIGHLDPAFSGMMEELKTLLRAAFQTANPLTFPLSAPGSSGMEMCVVNLVEPGEKVIVCQNGVFGGRLKENVERAGGEAILVSDAFGDAIDIGKVEEAFGAAKGQIKVLAFVHAETSTGVRSDAQQLCALAARHGALSIVDCVTSLGGIPVEIDRWGADAVYSGSQKCLSCPPGLSPVSFSERAIAAIRARKRKVQSWFLDLDLIMSYWGGDGGRSYHHTAPINALYGLHEALILVMEEGLKAAFARHARMHAALKAGLEALGLHLFVAPPARLPQLNAVTVPEGIDEAQLRRDLLLRFNLEIGAGLGPLAGRVWRIGLMGQSASARHVLYCLGALESALSMQQAKITAGAGVAAAEAVLNELR